MRKLGLALVIALSACGATAAPTCRAVAPAAIASGTATWIGPCANGMAEGVGTLRVARRGGSPGLFFGKMVRGRPFSGVMPTDRGDWRPAWRFDAGLKAQDDPSGDRQASIDIYRLAAAGANEASRRYRATGNLASARFYSAQGKRFGEALE